MNNICIIIPSLNEDKNLEILTKRIWRIYPQAKIIIVDDSSPFENAKLKKIFKDYKQLEIISRYQKMGRGSAVISGLKKGLQDKKSSLFFEMDADLAHDPNEIPQFIARAVNCDMVVGSRYLDKSRIIKWPLYRLVQSRVINFILRFWLGLNLTDYTNGFRMYSRKAVEFLVKTPLKEKGFIALSEIAYRLKQEGFKFGEVPISFTDREYGKSNADAKELLRSLVGAIRIRMGER